MDDFRSGEKSVTPLDTVVQVLCDRRRLANGSAKKMCERSCLFCIDEAGRIIAALIREGYTVRPRKENGQENAA